MMVQTAINSYFTLDIHVHTFYLCIFSQISVTMLVSMVLYFNSGKMKLQGPRF